MPPCSRAPRTSPNTTAAQAQAQSYVTKNGGGVANVTFPTSDKIRVTVTRNVPTYFAKIFGLSSVNVAAKAVATRFSNGPGALTFSKSTTCQATKINGGEQHLHGRHGQRRGLLLGGDQHRQHMIWNPASGPACLNLNGGTGWALVEARPPTDWPVPMPDLVAGTSGRPYQRQRRALHSDGWHNGKWTIGSPPMSQGRASTARRTASDQVRRLHVQQCRSREPRIFWSGGTEGSRPTTQSTRSTAGSSSTPTVPADSTCRGPATAGAAESLSRTATLT